MTNYLKYIDYLKRKKDIIQSLTDQLPVGIYRTSLEGKILYVNPALAEMLEYTIDELFKINVNDLFKHPKERDQEIQTLIHESKDVTSKEIILKNKKGKSIIVNDTVKVIRNKKGNIVYFDGILENITEKRKVKNELKENQTRLKVLTELAFEGIIIHDNGIIMDSNPSAQRLLGYDQEYLIGKPILQFIHSDSKEIARSKMKENFSGTYELMFQKSDNTIFVTETTSKNVIVNEKELRVIGFRDITLRKNAEKEIITLSTAIKQSPVSAIITDIKGNIEYVNPKFLQVTGYELEEVIGKNPRLLKTDHLPAETYQVLWETISNGYIWTGEFLNKRKDGTLFWELASISPIIDEKGKIIKYLAIKEDISERKKMEEALKNSEKELLQANATKNMFFSIMAHDLKGPIGGFNQLLNLFNNNYHSISEKEKIEYINLLMGMSKKVNNLLNDLLLWGKIQMETIEYTPEKLNLKTIIENTIQIIYEKANEKQIEIINTINNNVKVFANEESIKAIIRNLLSNAIKFSYRNSTIIVNANNDILNNKITISVKDNGVGIAKEYINSLFKIESIHTTYGTEKEKGTGLGLILCKELTEKNGGNIWVESVENKGSIFYLTLPTKD